MNREALHRGVSGLIAAAVGVGLALVGVVPAEGATNPPGAPTYGR